MSDAPSFEAAAKPSIWRWLRAVAGILFLGSLGIMAWRNGAILRHIEIPVLLANASASMLTVIGNSLLLRWITSVTTKPLALSEATLLSALGSLGNALGGLPIGTAAVVAILMRDHGIAVRDIIAGKLLATALAIITAALLTSLLAYHSPAPWRLICLLIAATGMASLFLLPQRLPQRLPGRDLLLRLCHPPVLMQGLMLAAVTTLTMMLAYGIIIHRYLPALDIADGIFISGTSLLLGFASMSSVIGGVQEVITGFTTHYSQLSFAAGVEISLFMRIGGWIAAATLFACSWCWRYSRR
jgi:hypothetical protein